jgi:hypothetical protein
VAPIVGGWLRGVATPAAAAVAVEEAAASATPVATTTSLPVGRGGVWLVLKGSAIGSRGETDGLAALLLLLWPAGRGVAGLLLLMVLLLGICASLLGRQPGLIKLLAELKERRPAVCVLG